MRILKVKHRRTVQCVRSIKAARDFPSRLPSAAWLVLRAASRHSRRAAAVAAALVAPTASFGTHDPSPQSWAQQFGAPSASTLLLTTPVSTQRPSSKINEFQSRHGRGIEEKTLVFLRATERAMCVGLIDCACQE